MSHLPDDTGVAEVSLTVRDLVTAAGFYHGVLGLDVAVRDTDEVVLRVGVHGHIRLVRSDGTRRRAGTVGLFHVAILFPTRPDLARALAGLIEAGYRLDGAADHLVSEALYLSDPEGNGIELYRDRPREEWPMTGSEVRMDTLPLDVARLLAEGRGLVAEAVPPSTRIGHVHVQVHDIEAAERFYRDVVGFDLMQRFGGQASFLSVGGYHHHLGVNTWGTLGASAAADGAEGLRWVRFEVWEMEELRGLRSRLEAAGVVVEERDGDAWFRDPSGHRLVFGQPVVAF